MLPETPPDGFPEIDHFPVKKLSEVIYPVWRTHQMMGLNVVFTTSKAFDPEVHRQCLPRWRRRGPAYWLWRAWSWARSSGQLSPALLWLGRGTLVIFGWWCGVAAQAAFTGQLAAMNGALGAAGVSLISYRAWRYLWRREQRHQCGQCP